MDEKDDDEDKGWPLYLKKFNSPVYKLKSSL